MIRQARSYLVGAVSGTTLVVVAVTVFIALVSLQTLRDWPLTDIGGGDAAGTGAVTGGGPRGPTAAGAPGSSGEGAGGVAAGGGKPSGRDRDGGGVPAGVPVTAAVAPSGSTPVPRESDTPVPSTLGGGAGQGDSASGGAGGRSRSNGSAGGRPEQRPANSGGGESVSKAVTGTVNETVAGVDEATGGALGEAGVTEATEEVVESAAGPDSTVGKTVDEATKKVKDAVGGALGDND